MDKDTNALNWFEIPATDLARATKFYETIFDIKMTPMEMPEIKMSMFPPDGSVPVVGGGLAQSGMHKPGANGTLVYLNANPDMQIVIDRIDKAGGKVNLGKTQISPEIGYMAFFTDTEGNTVGLHSNG